MKWRVLLWPLSLIYGSVTAIRNLAFNLGILSSRSFNIPVIAIGNLSTGGTGKTPMTEFLLKNLIDDKPAVVSRGYGRKTQGLLVVKDEISVDQIGDEPYQIHQKFPAVPMAVSEKRLVGIDAIVSEFNPGLVLLDDAFQHRYVKASLNILLTTYAEPYFNDLILPAGNLRESKAGRKRADIVVVTKCPEDLSQKEAEKIRTRLKLSGQESYFATVAYGDVQNSNGTPLASSSDVIALSGIAKPSLFINKVKADHTLISHLEFPDHHNFTAKDIQLIKAALAKNGNSKIFTTEKDWVRLNPYFTENVLDKIYFLPIELKILFDGQDQFVGSVKSHLHNFNP